MSEIKYGLISKVDSGVLEKVMGLIASTFTKDVIHVSEIGVYGGATGSGIKEYFYYKQTPCFITGIDNNKDNEPLRFMYDNLIIGNSSEVYNQIPDNSQHLIFIDALHTFPAVVADFFCYAPKVKVGGYLAFHDTGKHLDPLSGWQGVGDKNDPDMCLGGVRKALQAIFGEYLDNNGEYGKQWRLFWDEADPEDTGGGITVFKKLY